MDAFTVKAFAKINLSLDVLGTLPNGYHEVKMVMQTVSLYDSVELEKKDEGIELGCSLKFLPTGIDNLAYRAAEAFFNETGIKGGVKIFLKKHIPVGAGLAGGSSNAAAVLIGLNRLYEANLSTRRLCEIGTALGADVPYCIIGGTRLAEGIGEKLSPLPPLPPCYIVLVKPSFSISTKWVYDNIDACPDIVHPPTEELIRALSEGDLNSVCANMGNVLEDVSIAHYPILSSVKADLIELGAIGSQMSGSGPTVFGIFDDEEKALKAKEILWDKYKTAYICRGVNSHKKR
ncbi:MAG: 4-(cytidine 5'-diphospho)-2-C-methyl-D-erythritol kinase [Clostridia bacterium]|nr:4-(cytidine 5'-diphospho)-2-C-methyl-D-erythritol kinase [Clostridia bacterium]